MGDKLHPLQYPNSLEVRLKRLEAQVRQLRSLVQDQGASEDGPALPKPDPGTIGTGISGDFSHDGVWRPRLTVTVNSVFESIRGFLGYGIRITTPDGAQQTVYSTSSISTGALEADPIVLTQLLAPHSTETTQTYLIEVQVRSAIHGDGPWSEQVPVVVSKDTVAPRYSTRASMDGTRFGVVRVKWIQPTEPDYKYSRVYAVDGSGVQYLVRVGHAGFAEFNYDSSLSTGWVSFVVEHLDRSGNVSSQTSPTHIMTRKVANADLDTGIIHDTNLAILTDPTKFQHDIETHPYFWYDASGNYRGQLLYSTSTDEVLLTSANPTSPTKFRIGATSSRILFNDALGAQLIGGWRPGVLVYTGSTTIDPTSHTILVDPAVTGTISLTLPASGNGTNLFIIYAGPTYSVKIKQQTGDTIKRSASTYVLAANGVALFQSNGTGDWLVLLSA